MSARARLRDLAASGARAAGFDLVRRGFYSPVPDWRALPAEAFARRSPLHGIRFELDDHVEHLRRLAPHLREFAPPPHFRWGNRMYDRVEADVLHAVLRDARPARVIELGSGFSSSIIAAALAANAADGAPARYTVHDPYPRDFVGGLPGLELHRESAADVDPRELAALAEGDVLFIDTSHAVKAGSEVNHLLLDVLPTLAAGVLVHVHDVFLPYEYPRSFFEKGNFWSEQYLLQALLVENPRWEVLLPLWALVRERPAAVAELVPSYRPGCGPAAFWLRRSA